MLIVELKDPGRGGRQVQYENVLFRSMGTTEKETVDDGTGAHQRS